MLRLAILLAVSTLLEILANGRGEFVLSRGDVSTLLEILGGRRI